MIEHFVNNYYNKSYFIKLIEHYNTYDILKTSDLIKFILSNNKELPAKKITKYKKNNLNDGMFIKNTKDMLYIIKFPLLYDMTNKECIYKLIVHIDNNGICRTYQSNNYEKKYNLIQYYNTNHKLFAKNKNSFFADINKINIFLTKLLKKYNSVKYYSKLLNISINEFYKSNYNNNVVFVINSIKLGTGNSYNDYISLIKM